jgi:hypothetical protein
MWGGQVVKSHGRWPRRRLLVFDIGSRRTVQPARPCDGGAGQSASTGDTKGKAEGGAKGGRRGQEGRGKPKPGSGRWYAP